MTEVGKYVQNGPKFKVPTLVCSSYGTPYGCNSSAAPFYNALYYSKLDMYLRTLDMKNLLPGEKFTQIYKNVKFQVRAKRKSECQ